MKKCQSELSNKINIRSSIQYCYIVHLAQLTLEYDAVKCLLTYTSLIFKLEYSICAIASHPVSVISLPTPLLFHSNSRYFKYRKSSINPLPLSNKPPLSD